eukprot:820325_1
MEIQERRQKYQHGFVQLKCSLLPTDNVITIKLASDDWESNLKLILQTIQNQFQSLSLMEDSQWFLVANRTLIDKHNASKFGDILSTQIQPPAIIECVTLDKLFNAWQQHPTQHQTDQSQLSDNQFHDQMIGAMSTHEVHSLEQAIAKVHAHDDFSMNWNHLMECIKHEMWPKLASVIKAMFDSKTEDANQSVIHVDDLSDDCINNVMNILTTKKGLPSEESKYLEQLIIRAKEFNPNQLQYHCVDENEDTSQYKDGLNESLLMDIYDVHRIFVFANFNFTDYTTHHFKTDINKAFGEQFIETHAHNVSLEPRFNLYPVYIIDDDIFRVFEYHFGVSLFVNGLKHNLYIEKNTHFEIRCTVIPQSVSSVYDEHMPFTHTIGDRELSTRQTILTYFTPYLLHTMSVNISNVTDLCCNQSYLSQEIS